MTEELTTLETRRGTYRVPHVDLWRARFDRPRGLGVLEPGARVLLIGSCFARHGSAYLRRRGYATQQYRAGYLYNPSVVRLELEHVLEDREWPAEPGLPPTARACIGFGASQRAATTRCGRSTSEPPAV